MKKTICAIVLLAAVLLCGPRLSAQEQPQEPSGQSTTRTDTGPAEEPLRPPGGLFSRSLLTPSPDGCALMRSISTPVDKYTGVVRIEVPITVIAAGEHSVPVSLSYQASGIKAQDIASTVGLGWRLSAGGRITRSVRGWADDLENPGSRAGMLDEAGWTFDSFRQRLDAKADAEPDLFYFEYPGGGGMFVFDADGTAHTIPGRDICITYSGGQFTIRDADGTEYCYATRETTGYQVGKTSDSFVSAWLLDRIRYADGSLVVFNYTESANYSYVNYELFSQFTYDQTIKTRSAAAAGSYYGNADTYANVTVEIRKPKYLSSIRYRDHIVSFRYDTVRRDVPGMWKLAQVESSYAGRNPRKYKLAYSEFRNKNLKLTGLSDVSAADGSRQVSSFQYHEAVNLPFRDSCWRIVPNTPGLGASLSGSVDDWGYYNNSRSDSMEEKVYAIGNCRLYLYGGPALACAQANTLRQITYGTGGTRQFEYELHEGRNQVTGRTEQAGGLRIRKIIDRASLSAPASVRSYTYSGGVLYADTLNICSGVDVETKIVSSTERVISGYCYSPRKCVNDMTDLNGCPVVYSSVTEHLPNGASTVYEYVPYDEAPDLPAELCRVDAGQLTPIGPDTLSATHKTPRHWLRSLLRAQTQYDAAGQVTRSVRYEYARIGTCRRICGINYFSQGTLRVDSTNTVTPLYYLSRYYLESQPVLLTRTTVSRGRYNLPSTTEAEYDPVTLQPVQITRTDTLGAQTCMTIRYAQDFAAAGAAVPAADSYMEALAAMRERHVLTAPVETVTRRNGRVVDASLNLYVSLNGCPVLSERRRLFCDPDVPRTSFPGAYADGGRLLVPDGYESIWQAETYAPDNTLLAVSDRGGRQSSVLYGYRNTLPVAVVQNAVCRADDPVFDTYEQTLSYSAGKNYLTLARAQVVDFEAAVSDAEAAGRELEVRIEGRGGTADGIFLQSYLYPAEGKLHFTADLPAGSFFVFYRWTDAGTDPGAAEWPAAVTRIRVNEYRPAVVDRSDYVFHTSFEEEENIPVLGPDVPACKVFERAKTGSRVRQQPYELTLPGSALHPRDSLEVSWWTYHTHEAAPAWTFHWEVLPGGTSRRTYTIAASDSVYLDEVRVMPLDALMRTCTYRPGIGKTSETDASGVTTYYRYDSAGRLAAVLDTEGQLLKKYSYEGLNEIVEWTLNGNADLQRTVRYLDGSGREEQRVDVGASPAGQDVVQSFTYDEMGREDAVVRMPYAANASTGARRADPAAEAFNFYKGLVGTSEPQPFTVRSYDRTAQGALLKVREPQNTYTGRDSLYETTFAYGFNTSSDSIRRYELLGDTLVRWSGNYPAGLLRRVETGRILTAAGGRAVNCEFYDGEDRLVMACVGAGAGRERIYYLYDDFGRQRAVLPEPAQALFTGVGSLPSELGKYAYFTVYDRYGRVVKQLDPGGSCQQTLYDRRDRAVLSRRASMQGGSTWFFTHYDGLDRPVRTGIFRGGDSATHLAALEGGALGYPALQSAGDVLTEYLYDDYSWRANAETVFSSYPYSRRINTQGRAEVREARTHLRPYVRGLETGRRVKVLGGSGTGDYLTTTTFYDAMSRVIQTVSDQYPLSVGVENVVNRLDAVGNVTGVYVAQRGGSRFYHAGYIKKMTYDKRDRLTEVTFLSIFDRLGTKVILPGAVISGADPRNGKVTVAAYNYDELGRVKTKSIHNGLETTSYTYDLTHQLSASSPSFSYTLGYDGLDGVLGMPRYDGLLNETRWQHGSDPGRGYVYSYDPQGQMTFARYVEQQPDGGWEMSRNYSESVQYTTGGRVSQTLRTDGLGTSHALGRTYDGFRVSGTTSNNAFIYDADGNLTHDGIQNVDIQYNILGLPEKIVGGNHEIRYIYSAAGQKLASVADGSFTYYRNTLVYEDDSVLPTKMFHPEGFVALNVMQGEFQYKYFKRDHLGSVRALLAETNGTLVQEQHTDYYPFGAVHGQYENLHLNRYLFSGKELQDATIGTSGLLGWYDFGARHYNPDMGHWMAPDLLKQFVNPYLYCANSPANFVDPNGLTAYTNIDGKLGLYDDPYGIYNDFDIIFFGHTGPSGGVLYDGQYLLGQNIKIRFGADNIRGSSGGFNFTFPNPSDYGHGVPIPGQGMGGGSGGDGGGGTVKKQSQYKIGSDPVLQAIYKAQGNFWKGLPDFCFYTMGKMGTGITALGVLTAPFGVGEGLIAVGGAMSFASGLYYGTVDLSNGKTASGVYKIGMSSLFYFGPRGLNGYMTTGQQAIFTGIITPYSIAVDKAGEDINY